MTESSVVLWSMFISEDPPCFTLDVIGCSQAHIVPVDRHNDPPSLWRAFQCPHCGTQNQWRCRRSGKMSSSPTPSQLWESLQDQEDTWWRWGLKLSAGRSQHTEGKPWNEAPYHHCPAFHTQFARKGKKVQMTRCFYIVSESMTFRKCVDLLSNTYS